MGRGSVAAGRVRNSGIHSMLSESPSGKTENFRHAEKQGQMLRRLTFGWYHMKNDLTLLLEAPGGRGCKRRREPWEWWRENSILSYRLRISKEDGGETARLSETPKRIKRICNLVEGREEGKWGRRKKLTKKTLKDQVGRDLRKLHALQMRTLGSQDQISSSNNSNRVMILMWE